MQRNVITAVFGANREARTAPRHRYDYGQTLKFSGIVDLPVYYEMHFAKSPTAAEALRVMGTAEGVSIPDSLLQTAGDIYAWVYVHTGQRDGETVYRAIIPVSERPKPEDPTESPIDPDIVEQAIAALNEKIDGVEEYASAASESASESASSATLAESWAIGGTSSRTGEDTNNASYYAGQSSGSADSASASATNAESWAIGGTGSRSGEDTNNSSYFAGQASESATDASGAATLAESWAIGGTNTRSGEDTNNASYFATQAGDSAASAAAYAEQAASRAYAIAVEDTTLAFTTPEEE